MTDGQDMGLVHKPEEKKTGLIERSRGFVSSALRSLGGGDDLSARVESYTEEVTVVLEGMDADILVLNDRQEQLAAEVTVLAESVSQKQDELKSALSDMAKRLEALEKKPGVKTRRGIQGILQQVTWIAAIIGGAWVITTLLRVLGGLQ